MGTEEPQVKVGYLQLSEAEKKVADAAVEQAKTFLVSGFKDQLSELRKEWEKETDPNTRPGFAGSAVDAKDGIDFTERFGSMKRAVVDRSTNKTIGWKDVGGLQSSALPANQAAGESRGGWLPPLQMGADDRQLLAQDFGKFVDDLASKSDPKSGVSFNQLKFPRGDIENFSIARWAMATERAQNTAEGTQAYNKWAPYETAYYAALEAYSTTKAQGDMATGQDGGFLAPESWSTSFIDQIHPASATGPLPLTRLNMGQRVVHVPRLSANLTIAYAAENAALTPNQAQFQQVSFTARCTVSAAA